MLLSLNHISLLRTAPVVFPGVVTDATRFFVAFAILGLGLGIGVAAELLRPQLQIMNGSEQPIEIFYASPATRLAGHLAGYDPAKAPTFVWPERLAKAKEEIHRQAKERDEAANRAAVRETREMAGWTVHISQALLAQGLKSTARAVELLQKQLEEIVRVAPPTAVAELRKVPLYFSPEYPGVKPRAEFHPGAGWLRDNGRDPAMAKGVEFTNVRIFEQEMNRMPNFALHEMAHAYHDRVLPQGFGNPEIRAAYEKAQASGKYDRVERWHGNGKPNTFERSYAMTNPQEFFAETSEAFFSRNDFFPFTHTELKQHDPEMFALLEELWGVHSQTESSTR